MRVQLKKNLYDLEGNVFQKDKVFFVEREYDEDGHEQFRITVGKHKGKILLKSDFVPFDLEKKVQQVLQKNVESDRNIFETKEEKAAFVKNCEKIYGLSSEEFAKDFEHKKKEGNPDKRRWYRFYLELRETAEGK